MARRAMADHAVGGIHRLVGRHTGQAEQSAPEHRRHHAIGKILGEALDGSPHDTGFIEPFRIAPDDAGDGGATAREATRLQPLCHGGDMIVEAPLREQAGARDGEHQDSEPAAEPDHGRDLPRET